MFLCDDVIHCMWEESYTGWKQAILATLSGPLYYEPAEFRWHIGHAHGALVREESAPAFNKISKCSMRSYSSSSAISVGVIAPAA